MRRSLLGSRADRLFAVEMEVPLGSGRRWDDGGGHWVAEMKPCEISANPVEEGVEDKPDAEELPHTQVQYDAPSSPGEIRHPADIATVDAPGQKPVEEAVN